MDRFRPSTNLINFTSLTTVMFFLIVIAVSFFVLWPNFQELKVARADIEKKEAELESRREYLQTLEEIKTELEKNKEGLSKINTALPSDPSVPSLFNYLQKVASESGLILAEISPFTVFPSGVSSDLREITFNVKISGSYSSAKNFISTLEKSARLIEIESISLFPTEDGSFDFSLKLKSFSR
ncbi:MAG: type 4a pilus biogenesis protein PilO [bacterium]|nr:type 4a pilus biogenesis protein PilO [bacterium]